MRHSLVPAVRKIQVAIPTIGSTSLTGYDPVRVRKIMKLGGEQGWSISTCAVKLGVTERRLRRWMSLHHAVVRAYQKGIDLRGIEVENSLVKVALGYNLEERSVKTRTGPEGDSEEVTTTVKHVPPSVAAQKMFLERRVPKRWRAKEEGQGKMNLQLVIDSTDEKL